MVASNFPLFQYCDSNIGLSSIAPNSDIVLPTLQNMLLLTSLLYLLYRFCTMHIDLWFLFSIALCIVIALPTNAVEIVVAILILNWQRVNKNFKLRL